MCDQFCTVRDLLHKTDTMNSISQKAGSGRPRTVRMEQNIEHVAELICSQKDNPGSSKSPETSSSRSLQVCDSAVDCSEVVRDLGVFFDSEMSMKHHVSKTASACFYHIRRLRQIRHLVSREVLTQLVTSLVWTIVTPFLPAFPRRR